MRLTVSLCLWLAVATASVLGIHGWFQLKEEQADLEHTARREMSLLATAVRTGVESAVRDGQEPDIDFLLEQLERRDPELDVFVFDGKLALVGSSWGSATNLPRARAVLSSPGHVEAMKVENLDGTDFVVSAPVRVGTATAGHVVLIRPQAALLADLSEERRGLILSMVLVVIALSLTLSLVVHFRLHRPLNEIVRRVRNLAEGEFSSPLDPSGKDEIAELAREFDMMSQALEESRRRLVAETDSRERLQAEMQEINRLALVGQLAAGLAHEIGSPLQVLNGRARTLAKHRDLPQKVQRNAEILVEQSERIGGIVERLLSLARRKPLERSRIRLLDPVERVVELLSPQAHRQGVQMRLVAGEVPKVMADGGQVQQVVLNLLQNALRASSRGTAIEITVESSSFLPPAASREVESVAIVVDDEGVGIDGDLLPRIFDPLVTSWSDDERGVGTGLGLAVVKSIVTEHGGVVMASAGPSGRGSRFTVHFPAEEPISGDVPKES